MKVATVGGTGSFGRALAERLAALGHDVVIGSRDAQRAAELAAVYGVDGKENSEAVQEVDLVVLATKSNATLDTARNLADAIGRTPVLCVASQLRFEEGGVLPGNSGTSLAEEVAEILEAPVAAGLQTLAAIHLTHRDAPDQDALICGDDLAAKSVSLQLAEQLVGGRAIDAGPLANARALEGLTAVMLNVNKRYRAHAGIRVTGLEE
jgi:8-hydroxy-5-deazaflavin:NADPH oxidoreductase